MPKKPKPLDQSAIDMVTIGTFLAVSGTTYHALTVLEDIIEQGGDWLTETTESGKTKAREAIDIIDEINDHMDPARLMGAPTKEEIKSAKDAGYGFLRKYLGYDRPGGILK